jgi:hypothetical protein
LSFVKQGSELHTKAALVFGSLVNFSESTQRLVRFYRMLEARILIGIRQFAPDSTMAGQNK